MKYIKEGTEFLDQLKDSVHDLYDDNKELRELLEYKNDKIERLKKELNKYRFRPKTRFSQIIELRDRINKAIEYMEDNSKISLDDCASITNFYKQLLDILKGVDKE